MPSHRDVHDLYVSVEGSDSQMQKELLFLLIFEIDDGEYGFLSASTWYAFRGLAMVLEVSPLWAPSLRINGRTATAILLSPNA